MEGKRRLASGGRYLGWTPPYGYRKVGERANARMVIVPEEAAVVKKIYELYLTGQYGFAQLSRMTGLDLNRVRRILMNPTYAGKIAYAKRITSDHITAANMHEWIITDGDHEPIITEEDFWAAQRIREQNSNKSGPKTQSPHLFSRMVYCGKCGERCRLATYLNDGVYRLYYRCDRRGQNHDCDQRPIRHDGIEHSFLDIVTEIVHSDAFWERVEEELAKAPSQMNAIRKVLDHLTSQRDAIVRRMDNLVASLADGEIASIIRPRLIELEQQRQDIERQIAETKRESNALAENSPDSTRELMRDIVTNWRLMTVDEKREFIRIIAERFVVVDLHMTIHWTDKNLKPTKTTLPKPFESLDSKQTSV